MRKKFKTIDDIMLPKTRPVKSLFLLQNLKLKTKIYELE